MVYGIISDLHSNLEALTAVIEHSKTQGVKEFLCLGDIVGYNANPEEVIDMLQELNVKHIVKGNHDYYVASDMYVNEFNPIAAKAILWNRKHISQTKRQWLANLPMQIDLDEIGVTLVHSSLDNPHAWNYVFDKFNAESSFGNQKNQICFIGHTHVPFVFEQAFDNEEHFIHAGNPTQLQPIDGNKYLINVGSVGQPRDGNVKSSYITFDSEKRIIKFHRVEYDVCTTQQKTLKEGLPEHLAFRLGIGR